MNQRLFAEQVVKVSAGNATSPVILVCEHASNHIPDRFENLGLTDDARASHVAWDPGARGVAQHMARDLGATLVESTVSRLVYDCNRPPSAADAMPDKSEAFDIPGNANLSAADRMERTEKYYQPFHDALQRTVKARTSPILVTIHSFTPVYNGKTREVEIGILHDSDRRLADAYLKTVPRQLTAEVQRNAPYGPEHGVTHTLKTHAIAQGHLNVMIEIRNDLIAGEADQEAMAAVLSDWTGTALASLPLTAERQP